MHLLALLGTHIVDPVIMVATVALLSRQFSRSCSKFSIKNGNIGHVGMLMNHTLYHSQIGKFSRQMSCNSSSWISGDHGSKLSLRSTWQTLYQERKPDYPLEWLVDSQTVLTNIKPIISAMSTICPIRLLDLGCGLSNLVMDIVRDSGQNMDAICLDYTTEALDIQKSRIKNSDLKNSCLSFIAGDALYIPFKDRTFDIIIDKGTVDSILKNHENGIKSAQRLLKECMRVLSESGSIIQITDEDPDLRIELWDRLKPENSFSIRHKSVATNAFGGDIFMYNITKLTV